MNTQNILQNYGLKLDVVLDNSEYYDYDIGGNDLTSEVAVEKIPIYEKDLSDKITDINTVKINEINYFGSTYSGLTLTLNYTGFTSNFDSTEHTYSNTILNNDVYTYIGLTGETHYFTIYEFYSGSTISIDPLLTGVTETEIINGFTSDVISCVNILTGITGTCCPTEVVLNNLPWVYQTNHGVGDYNCSPYIQRRPHLGFTLDFVFNRNGLPWTDNVFFYEGVRDEYDMMNYLDNNLSFSFTSDGRIKWNSLRYTGYCESNTAVETYYMSSGQTVPLCISGTTDDFNITIVFERYYSYSGCSLPNEGGWNDLIHTGTTSTSGSTIIEDTQIENLSELWLEERSKRLGRLKIYLNGKSLQIDTPASTIRNMRQNNVYHFNDWEEIILSDRGNQPFTHTVGGGVTGSGGIHDSVCSYIIKYASYYEEHLTPLEVRNKYDNTTKINYTITECYTECSDEITNYIS